ncbi:hypothetical protein [Lysobacter gummosus]|uniref:hypothetical protein n=1 Tax=Lysobacter gummosus TaxID=262324 RepID=UPI003632E50A
MGDHQALCRSAGDGGKGLRSGPGRLIRFVHEARRKAGFVFLGWSGAWRSRLTQVRSRRARFCSSFPRRRESSDFKRSRTKGTGCSAPPK